MQKQFNSLKQVMQFAEVLGSNLKGGEVIELISDVGGGKTTFVRGVAKGAGSNDHVSSPTYKLYNIYIAPKIQIHHFDFYRLSEAGLIAHELAELDDQPNVVTIVEWSDVVAHVLPKERAAIHIKVAQNEARIFDINCPNNLEYLFK